MSVRSILIISSLFIIQNISLPCSAAPISVNQTGGDIVLTSTGTFQMRFEKSAGGNITEYYDLANDPGKTINVAVNSNQGTPYNGLYFIMFKQDHVGNIPELWTANFKSSANLTIQSITPSKVTLQSTGTFPDPGVGLPASYTITYTVTPDALIYINSKITFQKAYTRQLQLRLALCLTSRYGTGNGWIEYSQDTDLAPWYYYGGYDDDYIGARINKSEIKIDPVLIMYEDWPMADYVLTIAPPKSRNCLVAWVSKRRHTFSAGQVIENQFLLAMNQFNVTSPSSVSDLAKEYRSGPGGSSTNIMGILKPLLLDD